MIRLYMKKILYAAACILGAFAVSSCKVDEPTNVNKNPIAFEGTLDKMTPALGAEVDCTWHAGDELGVFVYATSEIKYKVEESASTTKLTAAQADIPVSYGYDAYAVYPYTGAKNRFEANVVVPNAQTISNGINPNLFVLAANAPVVDEKVHFDFKYMTSVINLGLSASEPMSISKIEIAAPSPRRGKYLAGESKVNLSAAEPVLGDITKGQNTITVSFAEPLALSSTVVYVPISVFPFETSEGGLTVKVYEQRGYPCDLGTIWAGSNEISDAGAVVLQAGESATEVLPALAFDMFEMPGTAKITVKDASGPRPSHEVSIYSVAGGVETFVDKFTSDANGVVNTELNAGDYVVYAPYNAGGPEKANKAAFTVRSGKESVVELFLSPVVFAEDFSWINDTNFPGVAPLYGDVPGHIANTAQAQTPQYTAWTSDQVALLTDRGWTASSFVFARPGALTLGKKNGVGTITSPKLDGVTSSTLEVTFRVIPWHTVTGGIWKLEFSQITIGVLNAGSFSATESVTTHTEKILTSGGDSNPGLESEFKVTIYGATSATQLSFCNGKPEESTSTMYRLMFSDVLVVEK